MEIVVMSQITNPLDLYKHLDKSNCRRCMLPSCMAFAVAVIQGSKKLRECPLLSDDQVVELSGELIQKKSLQDEEENLLFRLCDELACKNLQVIGSSLGLPLRDEMIGVNCLGKYFWINASGEMISECHKNNWVHGPILQYLLRSKGTEPVGRWITFNEIDGASEWVRFFSHRCEQEMRRLADAHTDLFFEILDLFGSREMQGVNDADSSFLLYPLPKVPFLINYWKPEDDFESKLNLLFDETMTDNINVASVYVLGRGLVEMLTKLIVRHNQDGKLF